MGIVVSGSSLGGIVVPLLFENLVHKIGFGESHFLMSLTKRSMPPMPVSKGWTVRTIAFMSMLCYAIAFFTIRTRLPFGQRRSLRKSIDWVAFKDPTFTLLSLCFPFVLAAFSVPFYYIRKHAIPQEKIHYPDIVITEIFATYYDVKPAIANNLVTIMNASAFVGRILAGMLGDRIGKYVVMRERCFAVWLTILLPLGSMLVCPSRSSVVSCATYYGYWAPPMGQHWWPLQFYTVRRSIFGLEEISICTVPGAASGSLISLGPVSTLADDFKECSSQSDRLQSLKFRQEIE